MITVGISVELVTYSQTIPLGLGRLFHAEAPMYMPPTASANIAMIINPQYASLISSSLTPSSPQHVYLNLSEEGFRTGSLSGLLTVL